MKKDKEKRKHHESTIGKIIYGFLLFLPLFAIGVTCGYAMFNKNAYITSEEKLLNKFEQITSNDNLIDGQEYLIKDIKQNNNYNISYTFSVTSLDFTRLVGYNSVHNYIGISYSKYNNGASGYYYLYYIEDDTIYAENIQYRTIDFEGVTFVEKHYEGRSQNIVNQYYKCYTQIYTYTKDYTNVKDAFYYSIDRVTQSNLFNWTKTSLIYTGMLNFTTAMNVTNTFIPMLLTYWLIISVIYFLYDIVLIILVVLHRKIHELQESI